MFGFGRKKTPPMTTPASAPAPATTPASGPDFSGVGSRSAAEELFRRGELEKIHMHPLALGGEDIDLNILYVPLGTADIKRGIDENVIAPLAESGTVTKYVAEAEYAATSVVPIAIKITASNPGHFTATINIWGAALERA
jgi:hypothetical protein